MRIMWDAEARAMYISLPGGRHRLDTELVGRHNFQVSEGIYLDFNSDNELVGIEILNADVSIFQGITLEEKRE